MQNKYIELRNRNTFGEIINVYFDFLKQNIKPFLNQYLRYNFISFILILGCGYLLVTGFMGMASRDFRFGMSTNEEYLNYLIAGAICLVVVLFVTYFINYSFTSSYMVQYKATKNNITSQGVWRGILNNLGSVIVFLLLGVVIYIVFLIISFIIALIPLIGAFAQYALSFLLSTVFGFTFISIFEKDQGLGIALNESWELSIKNFWTIVGYSIVIGFLNMLLTFLVLFIPGFLFGIYMYFQITAENNLLESTTASIIFTLSFCLFIIIFSFSQALSQISYGVLYYNLHEKKYNTFLQSQIDEIGVHE